jgi:hypothetical protein
MGHVEDFDIDRVARNWELRRPTMSESTRVAVAGMLLDTALSLGQGDKVAALTESSLFKDSEWRYFPDRTSVS